MAFCDTGMCPAFFRYGHARATHEPGLLVKSAQENSQHLHFRR